ncbi:hypothetical protein ABEB36_002525 [Hypothenemus hampei]|uniref:Uncharacterized protein n=1 Tax=Hypothenemus hampei TaxID=57062 RepID=A0ABD1F622_HYPHA
MKSFFVIAYLSILFSMFNAERWDDSTNKLVNVRNRNVYYDSQSDADTIQIPNLIGASVQVVKQVPYVEILKLVQSFLKIKGEIASQVYALFNDNAHIWIALRDTLITKISTLHNFTLNFIIVLRKVLEFASSLFGNINVNAGFSLG